MDLEYISHEDLKVTPDFINEAIKSLGKKSEWNKWSKWWKEHDMPEGLQLVELHLYTSTREYVERLLDERKLAKDDLTVVTVALMVDNMLH